MPCLDLIIDDGTTRVQVPYTDMTDFNYSFVTLPSIAAQQQRSISRSSSGCLIIQKNTCGEVDNKPEVPCENTDPATEEGAKAVAAVSKLSISFSGQSITEQPFAALNRLRIWKIHCIRPLPGHGRKGRAGHLDHPIINAMNTTMQLNGQAKSPANMGGLKFSFQCEEI